MAPGVPPLLEFAPFKPAPVELPPVAFAPQLRPFVELAYLKAAEREVLAAREAVAVQTWEFHRAEMVIPTAAVVGAVRLAKAVPIAEARAALAAAEKRLAAAEAEVPAIAARFAAERAKYARPPLPDVAGLLGKAAAKAEKQAALAKAEADLAWTEVELLRAAPAQKAAAGKNRDTAAAALANAKKAAEHPGDSYTPPRGSLKTPESNVEPEASRNKPFPRTSTGRRTALANWIADPRNPLTARVLVNHVWARHFGAPLVATVFDFGRKGARPTHPELLDWLAVEFTEHGWSIKHLHRLIVTSRAYRMSSSNAGAADLAADPENKYLWRQNPVRMEAEAVRDSLLHLAGELEPTAGGPSVPLAQQDTSRRRSLYFVHSHNDHHKFLSQFDGAGVLECYRRSESIVPQQALTLSNSRFALTMADAIARRLGDRLGKVSDEAFAIAAFEAVLAGTPTADERKACLEALAEWQKVLKGQKHPDPVAKARANLVAALVNHNDFVTVR